MIDLALLSRGLTVCRRRAWSSVPGSLGLHLLPVQYRTFLRSNLSRKGHPKKQKASSIVILADARLAACLLVTLVAFLDRALLYYYQYQIIVTEIIPSRDRLG
jgi:hypothetical protein